MYLRIVVGITRKLTFRVVRPLTLEAMFLLQPRRAFVSRYTWKASGPGRWAQLPDLLLPLQCTWLLHASLATVLPGAFINYLYLSSFRHGVTLHWTRYVTRHVIAHTLSGHIRISLAVSISGACFRPMTNTLRHASCDRRYIVKTHTHFIGCQHGHGVKKKMTPLFCHMTEGSCHRFVTWSEGHSIVTVCHRRI